jgi:hypothetical protein
VQFIPDNRNIRLTNLNIDGITRAAFDGPSSYRPIAKISFALNYYFHRYNVLGYHLVNILIHITTGILLYMLVQMTLGLISRRSGYSFHRWIPFFTVLIWLVHPIQTQSVSYIIQRMNSMAAMFYLLSFLLYGKARLAENPKKKGVLFAACIMSGLLSFGSKEIAATLPFFLFLYDWYFFQDLRLDPHDAIAHYNLGNALGNQKKFKEAQTHYEAAIRIKPDFPEARRNLQRTLRLISKSVAVTNKIARK